jgi:hypothetical protein
VIGRILEGMTSYYSSVYHDIVIIGNQVIAGIIVKDESPHTVTTFLRIGNTSSLYDITIVASGGNKSLLRPRELSKLEAATKDFIESFLEFSKKRDTMDWPCSNCGESYAYPVLSADGRYRCPKCANPVDSALIQ